MPAGFFVAVTAVLYVTHAVLVKYASGKIDPFSGIFCWSLGALLAGCAALAWGRGSAFAGAISGAGFLWVPAFLMAAAGLCIGIGSLAYAMAFNKGVDFSFATPVVNISVVTGGLVFGYFYSARICRLNVW
ncbi:MAG: hypothetical protein R3D66_01810 [Alphaproteobacteria bacterium]